MLIPFGNNVGKQGGAMCFVLMNKQQQSGDNDDGKVNYDNFNPTQTVLTNKLFLAQLMHFLEYNNNNVRVT